MTQKYSISTNLLKKLNVCYFLERKTLVLYKFWVFLYSMHMRQVLPSLIHAKLLKYSQFYHLSSFVNGFCSHSCSVLEFKYILYLMITYIIYIKVDTVHECDYLHLRFKKKKKSHANGIFDSFFIPKLEHMRL